MKNWWTGSRTNGTRNCALLFLCCMALSSAYVRLSSVGPSELVPVCLQLEGFCETITDCMAEQGERLRYYEELLKG